MKSTTLGKTLINYMWLTVGALVYAIGFTCFYVPNQLGFGGITGIAQMINVLVPSLPIGTMAFVMNIPLFLLGWKFIGGHLLVSSLYTMTISSFMIDLITKYVGEIPQIDPMLATVYGGSLVGAGLGIVFLSGATTGGTDIIARLLKLKLAWFPIGKLLLGIDLVIICSTALVLQNVSSVLYGIIALVISSKAIDLVLYGLDNSKVAYIISSEPVKVIASITEVLDRGITVLHGEGSYSGQPKQVLMCAFKQQQIVKLKELVKAIDPNAFMIVCDAHDVLGEGFKMYNHNDI